MTTATSTSSEADCFRVYRDVRSGFPETGLELGQGINEFPAPPALVDVIAAIVRELHNNARARDYAGWPDEAIEEACRDLIARHFGCNLPPGTRVLFTNGSSEGINLALGALTQMGLGAMLPLPSYFVYEQSVVRYGMPVAGRYRRFTENVAGERTGPYAMIETEPNPLDGTIAPRPDWAVSDPDRRFDLLDAVFLLAPRDRQQNFAAKIAQRIQELDLQNGCLLLTPSKDLSFPALRAGLVCTACPKLIEYIEGDQYARVFRPSPLIGYFCLFYLCVLRLFQASHEGKLEMENAGLAAWLKGLGIGDWYPQQQMPAYITHLNDMTQHCAAQVDRLATVPGLVPAQEKEIYLAGFSVFPQLDLNIHSHADLIGFANRIGRDQRLFLNPSIIFGGTMQSWDTLFPQEARIRVNISMPGDLFDQGLNSLHDGLGDAKRRQCNG